MIRFAFSANFDHLYRLTDNTGIRQRVRLSDPNPGYCVEQNAQALIVAIRALNITRESGLLDYVRHYMAFLEQAQRPSGVFRSTMTPSGAWHDLDATEEVQGVAVWALAFAAAHSMQTEVRLRALRCLDTALPHVRGLSAPLGQAYALLGLQHLREAEPDEAPAALVALLADSVAAACDAERSLMRARLPQALLATEDRDRGLETLARWCASLEADGHMGFSWPAEAAATVSACRAAHGLSGDGRFQRWAVLAFEWFLGKNVAGASIIDPQTGACSDRLLPEGPDTGQGAEALLAWLMASLDMAEG